MNTSLYSTLCPFAQAPASVVQYAGQILERTSDLTEYCLHIVQNTHQPIPCTLQDAYLLLVVKEGVSAQVHIQAKGSVNLEVFLFDNAQLTCSLSAEDCVLQERSCIGNNAQLVLNNRTTGDCEQSLVAHITGRNARSDIRWMFHALHQDKQRLSVCNRFEAADGSGKIILKGVAEQHAKISCNGMIEVTPEGNGTNASLVQEILLLDPTATADAVPALEIKTDTVLVNHSASIRRVTPEEIFYFSARGIEKEEARKMYVEGFLVNNT